LTPSPHFSKRLRAVSVRKGGGTLSSISPRPIAIPLPHLSKTSAIYQNQSISNIKKNPSLKSVSTFVCQQFRIRMFQFG
jgi:hypothetical protein